MINTKRNSFLKSFRFKVILASILVIAAVVILYFIFWHNPGNSLRTDKQNNSENKGDTSKVISTELQNSSQLLDKNIDSVLMSFGIKKDWITTTLAGTKQVKTKTDQQKKTSINAEWFAKSVLIPKDLTSAEVNLDLTNLIKSSGLYSIVNEDIRTTDIDITVFKDSVSAAGQPLARISVNHTDKITRESGTLVIVLSNLSELKTEQLEEIINSTSEFSFILPRNLEDIELQNKLIHDKKDLIINLSVGEKEAVETDFSLDMEDKEIKQRVKSFNVDFPSVKYVLLSTTDPNIQKDKIYNKLAEEFAKFDVKTIPDTLFFKFPDVEINSSKVQSVINTLKAKASNSGKVITVLFMDYDAFKNFYSEVLTLKKQGFKFYNFSQFLTKESDRQKKEKLLKERQEEDAKKKKDVKPADKNKKPVQKKTTDTKDTKKKQTTTNKK
ncbi:MAG: hypothetical protein EHM58_03875 [Ignavibacteriae bacterium]|nr:MAG: hypothetical protein EHM58_03875 [Ignavibacteriota bacterium]